jgi:alkylhydroperoxidase family enzyme
VAEGDLAALRSVGYTDTNILEIIALAAQFMMTNLINNAFDTDVDFPAIPAQGTPGAAST